MESGRRQDRGRRHRDAATRPRRLTRPPRALRRGPWSDPRAFVRPLVIVVLLLFVLLAFPSMFSALLRRRVDPGGDLLDRHPRTRAARRTGRHGVARPGRGAGDGRVGRRAAAVRDLASVPDRAARRRADHDGARHARRAPGAADERPVSGADHADARGRDHGRARDDQLPQRRPRLHRLRRRQRPHPADPPAERRHDRSRVLPLLGRRRDPDVPARARAHPRAAGTGVGGDPPERVGGAHGRHQHDVLQAVGIRARVVRHRRRRRPGCRQLPLPELADVRDRGLDHAAGGRADGRRVQHLGRDRRRRSC